MSQHPTSAPKSGAKQATEAEDEDEQKSHHNPRHRGRHGNIRGGSKRQAKVNVTTGQSGSDTETMTHSANNHNNYNNFNTPHLSPNEDSGSGSDDSQQSHSHHRSNSSSYDIISLLERTQVNTPTTYALKPHRQFSPGNTVHNSATATASVVGVESVLSVTAQTLNNFILSSQHNTNANTNVNATANINNNSSNSNNNNNSNSNVNANNSGIGSIGSKGGKDIINTSNYSYNPITGNTISRENKETGGALNLQLHNDVLGSSNLKLYYNSRHILFYCPTMKSIAQQLEKESNGRIVLGTIDWKCFADGFPDLKIHGAYNIRWSDVSFLADISHPGRIFEQYSVMCEIPRLLARSFKIIMPFFPTAQMERVENYGQIATAKTLARLLSSVPHCANGPCQICICDIHTLQNQFYFSDKILMRLETCIPLLIQAIIDKFGMTGWKDSVSIAFPDAGAQKRFGKFFKQFPQIICHKRCELTSLISFVLFC